MKITTIRSPVLGYDLPEEPCYRGFVAVPDAPGIGFGPDRDCLAR